MIKSLLVYAPSGVDDSTGRKTAVWAAAGCEEGSEAEVLEDVSPSGVVVSVGRELDALGELACEVSVGWTGCWLVEAGSDIGEG